MRLSEKTLELNFCSQFGRLLGCNVLWFGLTQKQEAEAGFDACTRIGGKMLIFQFKASSQRIGGVRRFRAQHDQMMKLKKICREKSSVFYAFPLIGTTDELANHSNIPKVTWLLDVFDLPATVPQPLRKSGIHYINVSSDLKRAAIHSQIFEVSLINAESLARGYRHHSYDRRHLLA